MIERYGIKRYIEDVGAEEVHRDGVLYRKKMTQGLDNVMAVSVVDSTPQKNGQHRTYLLAVPPWMKTAKQAVAWTFGLTEDEYAPDVES